MEGHFKNTVSVTFASSRRQYRGDSLGTGVNTCFHAADDGGNFTNIAAISGPIFKGVEGHQGDVQPTAMTDCTFFGNCSAGGCECDLSMGYTA